MRARLVGFFRLNRQIMFQDEKIICHRVTMFLLNLILPCLNVRVSLEYLSPHMMDLHETETLMQTSISFHSHRAASNPDR